MWKALLGLFVLFIGCGILLVASITRETPKAVLEAQQSDNKSQQDNSKPQHDNPGDKSVTPQKQATMAPDTQGTTTNGCTPLLGTNLYTVTIGTYSPPEPDSVAKEQEKK
jgi:hypothetical protein